MRVSNELGAAHPRTAKFSVVVAVITSFITGLLLGLILMVFQNQYPSIFSIDPQVKTLVKHLTPLLAFSIIVNNIQPTLSGKLKAYSPKNLISCLRINCMSHKKFYRTHVKPKPKDLNCLRKY